MSELVIHAKSASIVATATGVVVTLREIDPSHSMASDPVVANQSDARRESYDSVASYAAHRGISEKSVRRYLHLLPHATLGGVRIPRAEADLRMAELGFKHRRASLKKRRGNKKTISGHSAIPQQENERTP